METLLRADKLLQKAQLTASAIVLHAHSMEEELLMLCGVDAAWANRVDDSSTGGFLIGLAPIRILEGHEVNISLMYWASHRLRLVCRSSLAAEVQALANAEQKLFFARLA